MYVCMYVYMYTHTFAYFSQYQPCKLYRFFDDCVTLNRNPQAPKSLNPKNENVLASLRDLG